MIYFTRREFACPCCGVDTVDYQLAEVLDGVREHFGRPMEITSGFRCASHNTFSGTPVLSPLARGIVEIDIGSNGCTVGVVKGGSSLNTSMCGSPSLKVNTPLSAMIVMRC